MYNGDILKKIAKMAIFLEAWADIGHHIHYERNTVEAYLSCTI